MRLDLFLKKVHLIRYKELADELCEEGMFCINGLPCKINHKVCVGDELLIFLSCRTVRMCILQLPVGGIAKGAQWSCLELIEEKLVISDIYHTINPLAIRPKVSTNH